MGEFFNDNQMEQIKHEFEMESNSLHRNTSLSLNEIHERIACITDQLDALHVSHKKFNDVYQPAMRYVDGKSAHKKDTDTELKKDIEDLQIFHDEVKGDRGCYNVAKTLGLKLINQYQHEITKSYQQTVENHITY